MHIAIAIVIVVSLAVGFGLGRIKDRAILGSNPSPATSSKS
jgi:hypothetical protein